MRVLVDTNALIYLLDKRSPRNIQDRLKGLIEDIDKTRGQLIIPTLVVTEYLVGAGSAGKALLDALMSSRFVLVAPFDHVAAEECAAMQAIANATGNKRHPLGRNTAWQKVKVDRQIVASSRGGHPEDQPLILAGDHRTGQRHLAVVLDHPLVEWFADR